MVRQSELHDAAAEGHHAVSSEMGESWLPFMESTSACLAAHEQQIESLQVGLVTM